MSDHCRDLADRLSAYIDGELSGEELNEVLRHIEECECCAHCMEEIKATRDAIAGMECPEMPGEVKDRLRSCLKAGRKA